MSETLAPVPDTVEYPTSDGRPVAETDLHYLRLAGAAYGLRKFLGGRDDVYVGSNLLVYDEPGNPRRHLAPDVFVAFGVRSAARDLFKIWEEKPPAFVLEITSKSTRREDERTKRRRYAEWGVQEYFLYDPRGEWVKPPLQGFGLRGRRYARMPECVLPNGKRGLECKTLGLYLWLRDAELRLHDPATGRDLPTPEEEGAARELAEARLDVAVERVVDAEARATAAEAQVKATGDQVRRELAAMLARLAESRFGAPTAKALGALLERAPTGDGLTEVGDWILSAASGEELLSRVATLVEEPDA